jgi:hypothetical protein
VSTETRIEHDTTPVEAGIHRLTTIEAVGRIKVMSVSGKRSLPISIAKFIEAKLKPIHSLETAKAFERRFDERNMSSRKGGKP